MAVLHHPPTEELRLADVLAALGHPVRLEVVRSLACAEVDACCGDLMPEVSRSTLTHHWRVLRESGVIHQRPQGRQVYLSLRRDDLESRFPGLLDLVLAEPPQPAR